MSTLNSVCNPPLPRNIVIVSRYVTYIRGGGCYMLLRMSLTKEALGTGVCGGNLSNSLWVRAGESIRAPRWSGGTCVSALSLLGQVGQVGQVGCWRGLPKGNAFQLTLEDEWKLSRRKKCGRERCPGHRDQLVQCAEAERARLIQGAEVCPAMGIWSRGQRWGARALPLHGPGKATRSESEARLPRAGTRCCRTAVFLFLLRPGGIRTLGLWKARALFPVSCRPAFLSVLPYCSSSSSFLPPEGWGGGVKSKFLGRTSSAARLPQLDAFN